MEMAMVLAVFGGCFELKKERIQQSLRFRSSQSSFN